MNTKLARVHSENGNVPGGERLSLGGHSDMGDRHWGGGSRRGGTNKGERDQLSNGYVT